MGKHAYLIEAHKSSRQLACLLQLLDYELNDIFIHVDKKTKNFPFEEFSGLCKKSSVIFTERINVKWGGYSQIKAEMILLCTAAEYGSYSYYHLISGDDLPLRSQKEIHNFFCEHDGTEFVCIDSDRFKEGYRVYYRYYLQELIGKGIGSKLSAVLIKIQFASVLLQKKLGIRRNRDIDFHKGPNWFSITENFARFLIEREDLIKKRFAHTFCADEVFLQTLLYNSPFYKNIYVPYGEPCKANIRYVDWKRGNPYIFRSGDFEELMESGCVFARKFDENVDSDIIDKIFFALKDK